MIFNQSEFLFLFLPVVLVGAWLLHGRYRIWFLILGSFLFYAVAGLSHALVLALDIAWVYLLVNGCAFERSRFRLALAIAVPALGLVYFKYTGLLVGTFSAESGAGVSTLPFLTGIALPAGISFFTFQLISYSVDRYRGEVKAGISFEKFALFVSFFPQLVAGPIVRAREVMTDICEIGSYRMNGPDLAAGCGYFILGLGFKVLLADTLARYGASFAGQPGELSTSSAWYFVFNYSFRIYFDFYGYSLCAIGLGRMFGLHFPFNFNRPYEALNPKDFWRRWHMTLSYWIRDYLYVPLGGNRRYVVNILIVFAACGLWHGAAWTFVAWGVYHGFLVVGYSAVSRFWDKLPGLVQILTTFLLVSAGWSLFVFDFIGFTQFIAALAGWGGDLVPMTIEHWLILFIAAIVCFGPDIEKYISSPMATAAPAMVKGTMLAVLLFASILFLDVSETFIYFRF